MTIELLMLTLSAVLLPVLTVPITIGLQLTPGGITWATGNRDTEIKTPAWQGRARRAHANLAENIGAFAAIVLVAHVIGRHDRVTEIGAEVFFAARVLHALTYIAGVEKVRTLVFMLSILGELAIAERILFA